VVLQERVAGHFPDAGTEMKLAGHVWDAAVVITRMRYKNRAVLGMVRSRFGCFVDTKMPSVGRHVRQFELTGHSETSTIVQVRRDSQSFRP
jgi:hypothetical protein